MTDGFSLDFSKVEKDIPIPLYYQIKQMLLSAIQQGNLSGGDMIPTELEFCERCGVSRPTIRQALSELVAEGYLYRLKGKGTFVAMPKIDARFLNKLQSFNQEMQQKGLTPSTKVLAVEVIPGRSPANEKLNISASQKLIYLERLRFANGEPIVYLETFLPYHPYEKLLEQDFTASSLYSLLEDLYRVRVSHVNREIEAVNATQKEAALLDTVKNKALCLVKTVACTDQGLPVEYSVARYRGDRNKFSVELYR